MQETIKWAVITDLQTASTDLQAVQADLYAARTDLQTERAYLQVARKKPRAAKNASTDLPAARTGLKGSVSQDILGPFLACMDRSRSVKEPLTVLNFFCWDSNLIFTFKV